MTKTQNNRGTGAGGSKTNQHGLAFEEKIYLKQWLESSGYKLRAQGKANQRNCLYQIYKNGQLVGYYGRQYQFYNALKIIAPEHFNTKYINTIFSKRIVPDGFIISLKPRQLTIFEKKWQQRSGSVDEKIQTAPYKLYMFEKLLRGTGFNCQYQYILSKWFRHDGYRNVKEYYKNKGQVKLFVEDENLKHLNLDDCFK